MAKSKSDLQKVIAEADKQIAAAEEAKDRRRKAEKELHARQHKDHLDRLYGIGRIVYEIGLDDLDDNIIAGILVRGSEMLEQDGTRADAFRAKGKAALAASREKVPLEVLIPDRPDRSISAILREAGLRKGKGVTRDGKRWTLYAGDAVKPYLERRLTGIGAMISIATPQEPPHTKR